MARDRVSIRLQRIQQVAAKRGLKQRPRTTPISPIGFISRSRFAQIEVQEARQRQALDNIIKKISSLNNLNQINAVLNAAPNIIKIQVEQIRGNIANYQNQTVSKLQLVFTSKEKAEVYYSKKRDKTERGSRDYEKYKIREEEAQAEMGELARLIRQIKKGNLYDYDSVIRRVNDAGKNERRSMEYKFDRDRSEAKAQKETISKITKEGLTPVINANTGKLLGYQGGKDTGFAEYRFDSKGNPQFLKSTRFSPIRSRGTITGYTDNILKMSIPTGNLEKHISNISQEELKQSVALRDFQEALNKVKLPSGYYFERNKLGDIITISEKKKGICMGLETLPQITTAYMFNPILRKVYTPSSKEWIKAKLTLKPDPLEIRGTKLKKWWNSNAYLKFLNDFKYKIYKNKYKGKLSKDEFFDFQIKSIYNNKLFNTLPKEEQDKFMNTNLFVLTDHIKNPERWGTIARIKSLVVLGAGLGVGVPIMSLVGGGYLGALGLSKDVVRSPLPKDFKKVAKMVALNFGLGAVQALFIATIFVGGAVLGKLGKPLLKTTFGAKAGGTISKATQLLIQRGLSMLGASYISRLAGETAFNIKNIAVGDIELGAKGIAKEVGLLTGFIMPSFIIRSIRAGSKDLMKIKVAKDRTVKLSNNQKKEIENRIKTLKQFREGQLNAVYLKAKNAQLVDPIRGEVSSSGIVGQLNKEAMASLIKIANQNKITNYQLLDGAFYMQTIKIKSKLPETEAIIRFYKSLLRGRLPKVDPISNVYIFKRYGVVIASQTKKGIVEAFAIEFNYHNGKIRNIGFKTATGVNKITAIKVYQKVRRTKGKPIRVKFKDLFLVNNRFETRIALNEKLINILNTLETKKVFIGKDILSKTQLKSLESAIKQDFTLFKKPNLEATLKEIYKDKGVASTAGITNVIRIQRIKEGIKLIPSTKQSPSIIEIFPKGQYIEIGHSKFRIPSIKRIVPKKGVAPTTKSLYKDMQMQTKAGVSKINKVHVETAVKSIQTITKPLIRSGKLTEMTSPNMTRALIKQTGILIPLININNAYALRAIQTNLIEALDIQTVQQITLIKIKQMQIKAKQLITEIGQIQQLKTKTRQMQMRIQQLKTVAIKALKRITTHKPTKRKLPTKRKRKYPLPLTIPVIKEKKTKRIKQHRGFIAVFVDDKKEREINKLPTSKARAFDLISYVLDTSLLTTGKVFQSSKLVDLSVLKRKVADVHVPNEYFKKNRNKFVIRKSKTRIESYDIIKKIGIIK